MSGIDSTWTGHGSTLKKFDQQLFDADDPAKHLIVDWLVARGNRAWVNPDQFGIDVLCENSRGSFGVDVEVKHNWVSGRFPFDVVHWAERKRKFCGPDSWFVMLSSDRGQALVASGGDVGASPVVVKDTRLTQGESFMAVPLSKCFRVELRHPFNVASE